MEIIETDKVESHLSTVEQTIDLSKTYQELSKIFERIE